MKLKLRIRKKGAPLYEAVHEIVDQESFAAAFANVWQSVRQKRLEATTSIGELMEVLNDEVLEDLTGAQFELSRTDEAPR